MWDLQERAQPVDKVDILLSQQQAQTAQLSQLLSQAGGHGAKLELLAEKLTDVVGEMGNVKRHISECPARVGYDSVKTRLELIEKLGERYQEKLSKRTPKNGLLALPEIKGPAGVMRVVVYIIAAGIALILTMLGINV
jgi:hypothetical protein